MVNMQHDCIKNHCTMSGTKEVFEEQENSRQTVPIVAHKNLSNLVLNTAQMRHAKHVQMLRIPITEINEAMREREIQRAVEREIGLQAARAKAATTKEKGKAPARGQSGVRTRFV